MDGANIWRHVDSTHIWPHVDSTHIWRHAGLPTITISAESL